MPTFPVIHRTHLDIFDGEVVPSEFINQDGDPYLFQLYRRWGCSEMFPSRISNTYGGCVDARYLKVRAKEWTSETLDRGVATVQAWMQRSPKNAPAKVTLDVVIPCYRVLQPILDRMLNLRCSDTCSAMFIIIVDNPSSPHISALESKYGCRADVRIRTNIRNLGASASRNRGLLESAADWVLFLDDDVVPQEDILTEAEKVIRAHPKAAGFVGNSQFPKANSVFTTAVHLAGVTYFWDIATKFDSDLPWGVTANLIIRRRGRTEFDLDFPKTGGGEDIDYCLKQRAFALQQGGEGFRPAPRVIVTHPWWFEGQRSYRRFFMWSLGDGGLVKKYPEHTYRDYAPNSAELLLGCLGIALFGILAGIVTVGSNWSFVHSALHNAIAVWMANTLHDCWRHNWRYADRASRINSSLVGSFWFLAVLESTIVRMVSEMGRVVGLVKRHELCLLGTRFDWFAGRAGAGPRYEERRSNVERFSLYVALMTMKYLNKPS